MLSLLNQSYPRFEAIIVNDNSTDSTAVVLNRLRERFPHLTVVDGDPLPKGWMGKNWACHQGYQVSHGEIVLFTDADTFHEPQALEKAVSAMHTRNVDFLTAITGQETRSLSEKSVIPILFWISYSIFPFALMNRYDALPLSFGNGQFIVMRRSAYEHIGGHEAIKGNVFDDMTIAKLVRSRGLRSIIVDGSRLVSCRMYTGFEDTFKGLSKNIFMLFKYSTPPLLAVPLYLLGMSLLSFAFSGPILSLIVYLAFFIFGIVFSKLIVILTALGLALSLATFSIVYVKFNYPLYMIFLYPLNLLVFLAIAFSSLVLTSLGKTEWKGRIIDTSLS